MGHARDGGPDVVERDGAYVAEILREDDVGRERSELLDVYGLNAERVRNERLAHAGVDLPTGTLGGNSACGKDRKSANFRRMIALVGDPDEAFACAERADCFGGRG
jgi:hypothetical protein